MRCLTSIVMVILVAVVGLGTGYNYLQVNRISRDLSAIKAAISSARPSGNAGDLAAALKSANQHTAQAKKLLAKGQVKTAQIELDKSLKAMSKATKLSENVKDDSSKTVVETVIRVQKQLEETLDTLSKRAAKE